MATIAVDFDGTCVKCAFPEIGEGIGATPVLRELVANGHDIILNTLRENFLVPTYIHGMKTFPSRNTLDEAVQWFQDREIPLYGINHHPLATPGAIKVSADIYIDDRGLGMPLIDPGDGTSLHVDWERTRQLLIDIGYIKI